MVIGVVSALVTAAVAAVAPSGINFVRDAMKPAAPPPGPPLSWTVSVSDSELNACVAWVFAKPLSAIPVHDFFADNDSTASELWALRQGGVDVGNPAYTVTVQGDSDQVVELRDVRIKVLSRTAVTHGVEISPGGGCGGGAPARYYTADLTAAQPVLKFQQAYAGSAVPIAPLYTVSKSDPEIFLLEADSDRHAGSNTGGGTAYCYTYEYLFDWSQGSNSGTVVIDAPDGKPFRMNAPNGEASYTNVNGSWQRD